MHDMCDTVSLGNATIDDQDPMTFPRRSIPVGEPAQRAPTMMASCVPIRCSCSPAAASTKSVTGSVVSALLRMKADDTAVFSSPKSPTALTSS
jgi:hypothetical protein